MTTMRIVTTSEELTRLIEENPHLNLRSLEVGALGKETLHDGDEDFFVDVPFSMLEEGDWRIMAYSEDSKLGAKNYGGLEWDEVSQGRLRGFFHRLYPELPRRIDCSSASANIPEALNQAFNAHIMLTRANDLVASIFAEGDEYLAALAGRLAKVVRLVNLVCIELGNTEVGVDYEQAVPAMRLHNFQRQPCACYWTCQHELTDCLLCKYVGGHSMNCPEHSYALGKEE